ncbi:hypothetical protein D1BOALGB6SA_8581 [Olavius sp. associated proteobacterium Delta 1]|nr:hypothetical protein D1BOALGB6SA_8581 [Olavius sp. associated proteobacterium Delta 1]
MARIGDENIFLIRLETTDIFRHWGRTKVLKFRKKGWL